MPFCHCVNQPLITPVLFQALFDFRVGSSGTLKIAFVHDYDIGKIQHHDFLELQPAAVIRVHYQYSLVDNAIFLRSEERRVGKECWHVCRSRWSPYH